MHTLADALTAASHDIEQANQRDLEAGIAAGLAPALLQRLALPADKLVSTIDGLRQVAALVDPVGRVLRATEPVAGTRLIQETVPLGVIACIFESRPDVCIQIPALTLRSGNAVLLKGGKEAAHTNAAIIKVLRAALATTDLPPDAVQLLPDRDAVSALLACDGQVDLIVPRGSNELVRHIQDNTRIPVMGHAAGICHIYVDAAADPDKAQRILIDAKTDYPSACNAVETILVHESMRPWFEATRGAFQGAGMVLHDSDPDFDTEFGTTEVNVAYVPDMAAALEHIARHGSKHTEAILTESVATADQFVASVDAAGVFVNASTRFADGYRYGLGAEVGISTGKLHARGPVGLDGLVTTRWVLHGDGHVAGGLKAGDYIHRPLSVNPA